ncbi:MAG: hypothetical protein IH840_05910 [Candidatus Heimdallarchaeota archaeon]|nr:hypothetical protein [Candidatus Heimdallarchaeota archaeon]
MDSDNIVEIPPTINCRLQFISIAFEDLFFYQSFPTINKVINHFDRTAMNGIDFLLDHPYLITIILILYFALDWKLTRYSYDLYKSGYSNHIEIRVFELNPRYKTIIEENLPIARREIFARILLAILVGILIVLVGSFSIDPLFEFALGTFSLIFFGLIIQHIQNIQIFKTYKNNPKGLSGKVRIGRIISYGSSKAIRLSFMVIWLTVFLLTLRIFFLGGLLVEIIFYYFLRYWESKAGKLKDLAN